ncbi:MAG: dTDP-4-dehydrorhamnose 3,5-epimerase [Reyranellaceae bacterium]
MRFSETRLNGAFVIEPERFDDHRGSFLRAWCRRELDRQGLASDFVQSNVSLNPRRGTLRGMHWQVPPHGEVKLVRCVKGAVLDVIVDIRETSPTRWQWIGVELTGENFRSLYIPEGFAHGFQTLTDDVEVTYQVTGYYESAAARGLRHDDPALGIDWPLPVTAISDADASWPLLAMPGTSNAA